MKPDVVAAVLNHRYHLISSVLASSLGVVIHKGPFLAAGISGFMVSILLIYRELRDAKK